VAVDSRRVLQWFVDLMAVRTRYFDDFLRNATGAGIRQVVILASGLDARSYRLPWPSGSAVFEVDQPRVIEFKTATLCRAGLDPSRPTAWIAEGLLPFLSPDAQDRLLDSITALSATESQLATEIFVPLTRDMLQPVLQRWGSHGFDIVPSNLVYDGERHDVAVYLDNRGWQSVTTPMNRLFAANDLDPRGDQTPFADNLYYTSTKSAGST